MTVALQPLQMTEYYLLRNIIAELFGYRLCYAKNEVAIISAKSALRLGFSSTTSTISRRWFLMVSSQLIPRLES
jgi:hypothetical protein